jgi:hypothetical protein
MNTIVRTDIFDAWLSGLKDAHGKTRTTKGYCQGQGVGPVIEKGVNHE